MRARRNVPKYSNVTELIGDGAPFNAGEVEEDKSVSTPQEAYSEGIVGDQHWLKKIPSRKKSRDAREEGERH